MTCCFNIMEVGDGDGGDGGGGGGGGGDGGGGGGGGSSPVRLTSDPELGGSETSARPTDHIALHCTALH